MERDIRYALIAAAKSKPYLSVHILPDWHATPYKNHINHPNMQRKNFEVSNRFRGRDGHNGEFSSPYKKNQILEHTEKTQ